MKSKNIFKIRYNNVIPAKGKVLISEPFLTGSMFGRSVVLLLEHTDDGSMGLVINKQLPFTLNQIMHGLEYIDEEIPVYRGGPVSPDMLFFIHRFPQISGALPRGDGLYLNGSFDEVKGCLLEGNPIRGNIRFFFGYSGWEAGQLDRELSENSWLVGDVTAAEVLGEDADDMWKQSLNKLGAKYKMWARFPQYPLWN
jgi:putative transcriptional regulator